MSAFDSFIEITAFDALRFIYENGSRNRADGGGDAGSRGAASEENRKDEQHGEVLLRTSSTGGGTASGPELPGLWRVIESQLQREGEMAQSDRARQRQRYSSGVHSKRKGTPHPQQSPAPPMQPLTSSVEADLCTRTEADAAASQVATELVFRVLDNVVYDRTTAAQRYDDALVHFVLNSPLAPTVTPKLASATPQDSEEDSPSDESDLSQRPTSPRGFADVSFGGEPRSPSSPTSAASYSAARRRERLMLLSRYETCCEVMGMMPMSTVLDRLAGLDGGATSSLENSSQDIHGMVSGSPTSGSSTTLPYPNLSGGDGLHRDAHKNAAAPLLGSSGSCAPSQRPQTTSPRQSAPSGPPPASPTNSHQAKHPPTSAAVPPLSDASSEAVDPLASSTPTLAAGSPSLQHSTTGVASDDASATSGPRSFAVPVKSPQSTLAVLANVHAINLSQCEGLGRSECLIPVFGLLEGFPAATFLGLAAIGLTDAGATVLALLIEAHLPNLRGLDISRNPEVTDMSASSLSRMVRRRKSLGSVLLHGTSLSVFSRTIIEACAKRNAEAYEVSLLSHA